jgi:hypothetical protein
VDATIGGVRTATSVISDPGRSGHPDRHMEHGGQGPDRVDYGVRPLNLTIFYLTTAAICAVVRDW